jgi:NTE family protein
VIDILDSAGIRPDLIIGTSIGAVIGGFYAAGYSPKELQKFATETDWQEIFDLADDSKRGEKPFATKDESNAILSLRFNEFFKPVLPKAVSSGQRLTMLLNSYALRSPLGTQDDFIKEFRIPFVALATDIVSGERKLLTHGDLTSALRASATVPLRFNPLTIDSLILVDGGLLANVPVDIALDSADARFVIAVNTTSELRPRSDLGNPIQVADQIITLMMEKEKARQLARAQMVITPDSLGANDDFTHALEQIERGREAARKLLPRLKEMLAAYPETSAAPAGEHNDIIPVLAHLTIYGVGERQQHRLERLCRNLLGKSVTEEYARNVLAPMIVDTLRSHGYSLARIDSIRIVSRMSRLEVFVDEGHVSDIAVYGTGSVSPNFVKTLFPISKGDVFHTDEGDRGLRDLTATGYFTFASVTVEHDSSWGGTKIVYATDSTNGSLQSITARAETGPKLGITVEERAMNVLRLGLLADNEFGAQFSAEYANENVFSSGAKFSLKGGIGPLSRYATTTISSSRFFSAFTTFLLSANSSFKDISTYEMTNNIPDGKVESKVTDVVRETNDIGLRLRFGGEVAKLASLTAEVRAEAWRAVSTQSQQMIEPRKYVNALRGEFTFDSRDDGIYPAKGNYFNAYYETGLSALGSDVSYTKFYSEFQSAISLSRLHTIIPSAAVGVGDITLLRYQQFALGGINSFYGLNEYEKRGRQMAKVSLAYQVNIPYLQLFPTFFSIRYDLGATWIEPEQIKFEDFVHGIGAQLGFKTPIGPVRFGIGENFAFSQDGKKPLLLNTPRFYFSIGGNL